MKRLLALLLSAALAAPGCALGAGTRTARTWQGPSQSGGANRPDPALIASFLKQIPIGSRVRVDLVGGKTIRGTLMRNDTDPMFVQRRTRVPEPPTEIRIADVIAIELDQASNGVGKSIAIGAAAGAGAAIAVILLLAAIFSD